MTQRIFTGFTAFILTLSACSNSNNDDGFEEIPGNSLLLNFTSDYNTGELRWMDPDSTRLFTSALSFGQDSRVSASGGNIFVLSSYPGVLACISPEKIGIENPKQNSIDALNPHEAAVIGDKGYIALNDENYLQVFNVSSCTPSEKINLPVPNTTSIKASGDTLLVISQRLDNYEATKPGLLIRIKASTENIIIDTIQLKFYNPYTSILSKGKLYVSAQARYNENGSYDFTKSGVEVVDLVKGNSEILATGAQLGGGAYGIALDEENQTLYVSVSASWGATQVKPLNSKAIGAAMPNITDANNIVFDDVAKKLFAGDASGLKIYDPATKITTPVNEGADALPPYSLAIVRW